MPSADPIARVDHLVYATPDVAATTAALEAATGVRATPGGAHPGRGTRNTLLALGPRAYLEIVGPDAEQPAPARPRWFGIDGLRVPRLATWAATVADLDRQAADARAGGVPLGAVRAGSRRRLDGALLAWRFTDPDVVIDDGVVPFLIDWGDSPHPAGSLAHGASLVALRAEHPDAASVGARLVMLGLALHVDAGPVPALVATLRTPRGAIVLR